MLREYWKLTHFPVCPDWSHVGGSGDKALESSDGFILKPATLIMQIIVNFYLTKAT